MMMRAAVTGLISTTAGQLDGFQRSGPDGTDYLVGGLATTASGDLVAVRRIEIAQDDFAFESRGDQPDLHLRDGARSPRRLEG